jgi:uncharacterized damage-inducible protein DinB
MADNQTALLIQEWERARAGAEEFITAMPDEKLSFRPVPEVLSFAGQFLHIAEANYMFASAAFGVESPYKEKHAEENPDLQTKAALLEFVVASYDFIAANIAGLTPEALDEEVSFFKFKMPRHLMLSKALEHHAHHRGQTAVYFRLQGMKPPSERLF